MSNSYIYTGTELSMVINNVPYTIDEDHPHFDDILDLLKENRWDDIPMLVSIAKAVHAFGNGKVVVDEDAGVITYNGEVLHNSLTDRILQMMNEGFTVDPFVNFVENLMSNPSKRAVDELYTFLEYGKLPITEDGCFLAYKRVRGDYKDCHSGTIDNSVGQVVEMERNKVDDRSENTCSYGLHFCSLEYLKSFSGTHVMILKINPRDVVSIPVDYNNTKGRCCKYEVVGEYEGALTDPAFTKSVYNSDGSEYDDENEEVDRSNYDEGYSAGQNDRHFEREAEYSVEDLQDAEDNGDDTFEYIRGYVDGFYGNNEDIVNIEGDEVTTDYIEGYVKGHKAGRKREYPEVNQLDLDEGDDDDYGQGYVDGYKDGKSHKARKHTQD